jgi:hypothetical protein
MQRFGLSLQIYEPCFRAGAQSPAGGGGGEEFSAPAHRQGSNLTNFMELSPSGEDASCAVSQHSMEAESSLPCTQEPSTCSYSEPD